MSDPNAKFLVRMLRRYAEECHLPHRIQLNPEEFKLAASLIEEGIKSSDELERQAKEIASLISVRDKQEDYMANQGKRIATLRAVAKEMAEALERAANRIKGLSAAICSEPDACRYINEALAHWKELEK